MNNIYNGNILSYSNYTNNQINRKWPESGHFDEKLINSYNFQVAGQLNENSNEIENTEHQFAFDDEKQLLNFVCNINCNFLEEKENVIISNIDITKSSEIISMKIEEFKSNQSKMMHEKVLDSLSKKDDEIAQLKSSYEKNLEENEKSNANKGEEFEANKLEAEKAVINLKKAIKQQNNDKIEKCMTILQNEHPKLYEFM